MELTGMEEEGIEILAENIQKKNFIRKISSVTEVHNTIYSRKWSWVCGLDLSGVGYLAITRLKEFAQKVANSFTLCELLTTLLH